MTSHPRTHFPTTQLGGQAFSHGPSSSAEAEYDRLRSLARQEHSKRSHCFDQAHQAYERGDGGAAHNHSEEGKRHGAMMEQYNRQASDYIFRENNAEGRVDGDTIDLHGQYVEEAEDILEARIRYAQGQGRTHLHVIVGKGGHSRDHVQKIKPRVEQVCRELGLQFATEENAGRIYVNLKGGPAVIPELTGPSSPHNGGQHAQQGQYAQQGQQGQQGQYQQQGQPGYQSDAYGGQQQQQQQDGDVVRRILKKLDGCCVVM